ncbi:MAG: 2TM domain-containing protein [Heteroscytonema crispum UTEX LB 1556]
MNASGSKITRSYTQDDVQQILQLAIARQADDKDKEFSYDQLMEIASELEISPESLKLAENDWLAKHGELQQRKAFNAYRLSKFKKRFGNYVIVNGFLVLIDFVGGGTLSWSLYILLFWGLAVVLDVWNTFQIKGEEYEIAFQKWSRKHQIKQTINTVINKWLKPLQI